MCLLNDLEKRTAVKQDVVKGPGYVKFTLGDLEDAEPHQHRLGKCEPALTIGSEISLEPIKLLVGREQPPILMMQIQLCPRMHSLLRLIQTFPMKAGSKDGVMVDNQLPGSSEDFNINFAAESEEHLLYFGTRLKLIKRMKKHPLL